MASFPAVRADPTEEVDGGTVITCDRTVNGWPRFPFGARTPASSPRQPFSAGGIYQLRRVAPPPQVSNPYLLTQAANRLETN